MVLLAVLFFIGAILFPFFTVSAAMQSAENCTMAGGVPCGDVYGVCCHSQSTCDFRRGIPFCLDPNNHSRLSAQHTRCSSDPYLFQTSFPEFCCPLGTMAHKADEDDAVHCVDAVGVTQPAVPTASSIVTPAASDVPGSDARIVYSPPSAWTRREVASQTDLGCSTLSQVLHFTDVINSTISFSYTGPSIRVHAIKSPQGGAFTVFIDGFNTSISVDTYRHAEDGPSCYAIQFPPMGVVPPGFESRIEHTVTLVFRGSSTKPGAPKTGISVLFDSFSVPIYSVVESDTNGSLDSRPTLHRLAFMMILGAILANLMYQLV